MIYLTGDTGSRANLARLASIGAGRMMVARYRTPEPGEPWALDCHTFVPTVRGESWDNWAWLARLQRFVVQVPAPPLFAVLPDRPQVAGGEDGPGASLRRSLMNWGQPNAPGICRVLAPGWRWLLPVQDGMELGQVREALADFPGIGGLFLGGSDRFKVRTAASWCGLAHELGLWFHYGRAGTRPKLQHAREIGADSADSAFPLRTAHRFDAFCRELEGRPHQPPLPI